MNRQFLFARVTIFCAVTFSIAAMEKAHIAQYSNIQKHEEYKKQVYFVHGVSHTRAEAYCNVLCREQMGFAKALKYHSIHTEELTIKPLESFLKRFSTEVISRSIILRNPHLKEDEYDNECKSALRGLEMSESFLHYLISGKAEEKGRTTKKEWHAYWKSLDNLNVDENQISPSQGK